MKTQLIILSSGTIYQSSGTIDLYDDVPMSLNYSIADIKEPEKRNADYSKTITVPGTNNNNHLLSNIYEIGIDRLYNPNKKVEARILYDSITVMKGYIRLVKIRTLKDQKIEYDFEIRGRLDDLFTAIKDKKLTDITWTDLDHTWNKTNIKNSWTAAVGSNYIYPYIDYGFYAPGSSMPVFAFRPAVYLKEVWDRIFSYAGFQYTSAFLTGNFFKRLFIPFTSDKMRYTEAQINLLKFRASRKTTTQTFTVLSYTSVNTDTVIFNDDTTSPNEDTGNNYVKGTGIWTCPTTGLYNFYAKVDVSKASSTSSVDVGMALYDVSISPNIVLAVSNKYTSGTTTNLSSTLIISTPSPLFIIAGAQLKIVISGRKSNNTVGSVAVTIAIDSFFLNQPSADITQGGSISFVNTLPQKIKMSEILLSVIKMFNLYIEYDKDTPNKLRIEPRNDFYNSTIQDWSDKLDVLHEPEITPMGALDAKRYIFRYKKDNDWLNTIYQDTYGQGTESTYGERLKDVDNDFLKNDNVMESIFSATPLYSDSVSNRVYPRIVKLDPATQTVSAQQSNIRILYYGGVKTSTPSWTFYDYVTTNPTTETQYPYCGHLDDPDAPTIDLSFGVPKEIYYVPIFNATYTNNNIYNVYWRQMIEEITDYNSSIVTAWFWLTPADILEVDFRHIYRFKNQHFRLNKIFDYNPSANSLTKCEFIKLKAGRPFVAKSTTYTGASNSQFAVQ